MPYPSYDWLDTSEWRAVSGVEQFEMSDGSVHTRDFSGSDHYRGDIRHRLTETELQALIAQWEAQRATEDTMTVPGDVTYQTYNYRMLQRPQYQWRPEGYDVHVTVIAEAQ